MPPALRVVGAALIEDGRCLVARRGARMSMAGRWELPGGKVERRERPRAALRRELREELGIEAEIGDWLGRGEAKAAGRLVRLDVFAARVLAGRPTPHEHAELRWLGAGELAGLDWAPADVPVLPALATRLRPRGEADRCVGRVSLLAADWGRHPRKRAVRVAECDTGKASKGWAIRPLPARDEGWSVRALLDAAHAIRARRGGSVVVGIDVSLGVPHALARRQGAPDFPAWLRQLEAGGGLVAESPRATAWRPERPFFRIPPGRGARLAFMEAAGGRTTLLRQLELRTGGNPSFVLSGIPGSVGSGSRAVWQELAPLLREREAGAAGFRLWPFEGDLGALCRRGEVVLGEIYPRAAYALALAAELPAPLRRIAKTKPEARAAALAELRRARWIARAGVRLEGLAAARASEDDFDALLTAAAMTRAVAEGLPLAGEAVDPLAEGGMLATGGVVLRVPR